MNEGLNITPTKPVHANKRNPVQRALDAAFVEDLAAKGKTVRQIMRALNERPGLGYQLSLAQVHHDLKKVEAEWVERANASRETSVARELAGLKKQEGELWEAWHKSKLGSRSKTTKAKAVKTDTKLEALENADPAQTRAQEVELSETVDDSAGDPQFMRLILEIRAQRRALLGLDKPTQTVATVAGPDGGKIVVEHKVKKEFDMSGYENFCTNFFRVPSGDRSGQPVHSPHAGAEAGLLSGPPSN